MDKANYSVLDKCVVCGGIQFDQVFRLEDICLTGYFPRIDEADPIQTPITLNKCRGCGLIQMREKVDPELMFRDYWYRSATTGTMRAHLGDIADQFAVDGGMVLDIGCNDGTLMGYFEAKSMQAWGVDPSSAVNSAPNSLKERIVNDFFSAGMIDQNMANQRGKFDLVTAISMFYDVPEPRAFLAAIASLLKEDGRAVIEVNYAKDFFVKANVDMLGQEHLVYYFISTFQEIIERTGLYLVDAYLTEMNGGNITFILSKQEGTKSDRLVQLTSEESQWLAEFDFLEFQDRVRRDFDLFATKVRDVAQSKTVKILGASTRGALVAQMLDFSNDFVAAAVDLQENKKGRRVPGTNIVIEYDPEHEAPDVYIVMPYQFKDEIIKRYTPFLEQGGELLFYRPQYSVVRFETHSQSIVEHDFLG